MFGFHDVLPPARIARLTRCYCGRWLTHLHAHIGCAPMPLAAPTFDLRRKSALAPWRTPVMFTGQHGMKRTRITLECGHVVVRSTCVLMRQGNPRRIRCEECFQILLVGAQP